MARMQIVRSDDSWDMPKADGSEQGSSFDYVDSMFLGYRDGAVFDYGDWEAREMKEIIGRSFNMQQLVNVQALPIISAENSVKPIKKSGKEFEWLEEYLANDEFSGGMKTTLDEVIGLMTSAFVYKRAYFEKIIDILPDGKTGFTDLAWRPQTTARLRRDAVNGRFLGFEQEPYYLGGEIRRGKFPLIIPENRAFVYIHGTRTDPMFGSSDMEVPLWCWKTMQKLMFLWFQFLEGVSLPRTVVTANDEGTALAIAKQVAGLKASGVLPISAPGGASAVNIQSIDSSGKGADQFKEAIAWLDQSSKNSALAGFLNLTNNEKTGGGWALSNDASDFFNQTLESKAREMERAIRSGIFAPLIRWNFGNDAPVPRFKFEPLNAEDKADSIALIQTILGAKGADIIPNEFVSMLAHQVADYLGMDGSKVEKQFMDQAKQYEQQKTEEHQMQMQQFAQNGVIPPAGATKPSDVARSSAAAAKHKTQVGIVSNAVSKATRMVKSAQGS